MASYSYTTRSQVDSAVRRENGKINSEKSKQTRLNEEIDRLKRAYERVQNLKNNEAENLVSKTKPKNSTVGYDWRGKWKDDFDGIFEDKVSPYSKKLVKSNVELDEMADEILRAINKKEDEVDASEGIVRTCKRVIRDLKTFWETLTN